MNAEIQEIEMQIFELSSKLVELRKAEKGEEVPDYTLATEAGEVSLGNLFGDKDQLLLIHNMGQGCRYCTVWADGLNGFLPHLESAMSVALVSKDDPATQRRFANSRGWRFRLASHGGGDYIKEQTVMADHTNVPGAVVYERDGDVIRRKNACVFGPGDLYCSLWHVLGMAGLDGSTFTPQFNYWKRPEVMDDGGENLID